MPQALKKGIPIYAHDRQHAQREQRHCHDDHLDGARHRQPHQFRAPGQNKQKPRLNGIAQLQHPAQYLTGIRVVRRNGVYVVIAFFFHSYLPIL